MCFQWSSLLNETVVWLEINRKCRLIEVVVWSTQRGDVTPVTSRFDLFTTHFNPQAPVEQKIADEVVFRHFPGEGVEFFFKSDLTDPPSDFWCASFGKYRFKPFQISFFSGFYIKIIFWVRWFYSLFERMRLKRKRRMLIHTNKPLVTFYKKRYLFFAELAMSQRWSAIFCATGVWGVNRSGVWGSN